jgi:hypothetical protein
MAFDPKRWHGSIEQALSDLGYTEPSYREVWCYDVLLLPTFHAPGWVRVACEGDETYAHIAVLHRSERFEAFAMVAQGASDALLAEISVIEPGLLHTIDEGGRDGLVVQCWWHHHSDRFTFFAHNPTRAHHAQHMHFLDRLLAVITESFRSDQTVQDYLAHIRAYLSS